jgi:hypothetical protein
LTDRKADPMMSNLELNVHRARVADMARFADQHRTMHAIRRRPPHLIRVPDGAVQSAPQPPRLEALGGAK